MSIARTAAHGVAWNMVFGISSRVLQLVGTLILTRFIAPDEYGAVLAASITVVTAGALTSFAFGQYLIAKKAPPDVAFQAATLHMALGVVSMSALVFFRHPIAEFLEMPAMAPWLKWYAFAHLIDRSRYVPERLLMRDLRFRNIAMINGGGELLFTIVALSIAPSYGPYAIVIAVQARAVFTAIGFFAAAPRAEWLVPSRIVGSAARGLFGYGLPIMLGAVADRAATRWDTLILSKLFGPGTGGQYNLAYSLAEMPVSHVAEHIGEVLMPSFSRMEDAQRRRAVVRAAAMMAVVVSPLGVGLGAVAPTVVAAFFNEKWADMGPMLAILSIMTVFRPMTWSAVAYLQAVGHTRLIATSSFSRAVVVLSLVGGFGYFGNAEWACVGATIGYAVHSIGTIIAAGRVTNLPIVAYLVAVLRPLLACVPMFAAVTAVDWGLHHAGVPEWVSLAIEIATGAVVYVASVLLLVRDTSRELIRLGKGALRKQPPDTATPSAG